MSNRLILLTIELGGYIIYPSASLLFLNYMNYFTGGNIMRKVKYVKYSFDEILNDFKYF